MQLPDRPLGRIATLVPNRKFTAAARAGVLTSADDFRSHAAFVYTYYARLASLGVTSTRNRILDRVEVVGLQHLRAVERRSRGALLLSVHLGDFDAAGAWLATRQGLTPVVVTRPIEPPWRERAFSGIRRRCGVIVRDATATRLRDLERDLSRGRVVLVMLDRRAPGPTLPSWLLGRPATAPLSIAVLAARTGAPLLPAASWRAPNGRVVAWFGPPVVTNSIVDASAAIVRCADALDEHIRAHPEQWHVPADLSQMAWTSAEPEYSHAATRAARESIRVS